MKFNALVVAAMVIASVNAGGADELPVGLSTVENIPQIPEPKKLPICEGLKLRLDELWDRAAILESELQDQLPEYLNLMKGLDLNGEKIEEGQLGSEQAAAYSALDSKDMVILKTFDEEYGGVMEDYGMTWGEFERKCPAESRGVLSLEEMVQKGQFLQLPDAYGVTASSEQ
ncbi:hypothetical protein BASA50_009998 [Batrachochytrium salamandrivorans]|uniref:Uncharacterized protein n=1 Tax=Batrachochytrium salamandrivorans TaxID=1357716 RepID=A0ABQ8F2H6_9FUNG|nr:hypothetical protein BASA50_009998 [Batrachochytrium salamandrivorans]